MKIDNDGLVKVRCKHSTEHVFKSIRSCPPDEEFDCDRDLEFETCESVTYIKWTSFIIYKKHLVEVEYD